MTWPLLSSSSSAPKVGYRLLDVVIVVKERVGRRCLFFGRREGRQNQGLGFMVLGSWLLVFGFGLGFQSKRGRPSLQHHPPKSGVGGVAPWCMSVIPPTLKISRAFGFDEKRPKPAREAKHRGEPSQTLCEDHLRLQTAPHLRENRTGEKRPERHSGVQRGKGFLHVAAGTATRGGRGLFHLCKRCCVTTSLREQALSSPLLSRSHFMLTLIHFLRKEQHVAFCVSFSHPTCHFFASLSQAELW